MKIFKIELADFGNLFRSDPAKLSDQELLSLDFILHRAWKVKREDGRVHFGDKSWSFEDLINLHAFVRHEMSKRAFQHTLADELDQQTLPFLKAKEELAPVHPSGVEPFYFYLMPGNRLVDLTVIEPPHFITKDSPLLVVPKWERRPTANGNYEQTGKSEW